MLTACDGYLDFLAGVYRPTTVVAAGYVLKVSFTVVGKTPDEACPADVLDPLGRKGTFPAPSPSNAGL